MLLDPKEISTFFDTYKLKLAEARKILRRPITFAEKILFTHMKDIKDAKKGEEDVTINVDRVAMQDATAQMAILQFILTNMEKVEVNTSVHCDHLIRAEKGATSDLDVALTENNEVYAFLKSAANKYGMGFWKPGSGIIHQVVLENYAVPGMFMIGTDSHTPNAGGLSMISIGVGGADAVDVMAGEPWSITMPKLIGVKLNGKLSGWTAPKDIILKVAEKLTVKGGTGYIIEYFGEGARSISATGKATITNMGAEIGATTSLFPYDEHTSLYLKATQRGEIVEIIENIKEDLQADKEIEDNPTMFFDKVIEIDLNTLEPHIVGPFTPDLARPVSKMGSDAKDNAWPLELTYSLIGSCTNSSYEDMSRAASLAKQAAEKGIKSKCGFMITPGSEKVHKTIQRDGQLESFEKIGGVVLANACGPCIGQWTRIDIKEGEKNSILSSFNRNFKSRNDANPETHAFIASPEIVTAYALAGRLDFNPLTDAIETENGSFKLDAPKGDELPQNGFVNDISGFEPSTGQGEVEIKEDSDRLSFLELFSEWNIDTDFKDLFVLVKAKGKCTTDHVSPAGPWLKYRGHLDKISDNMYTGAVNAFTDKVGTGRNLLTNVEDVPYPTIARQYKSKGKGWVVIGDTNYGEGSSREHAAMEPRYLGCVSIICKSFARIAETNLKKQGILPLWFVHEEDYDKIKEDDLVSINNVSIMVGKDVDVTVKHSDGSTDVLICKHTFSNEQIKWFKAGSALNMIRNKVETIF